MADEAVKAAKAGAAIVHVHVRDPNDGKPTPDLNVFREVLADIKSRSDVVICTTTGGGIGMIAEERIRVVPAFKPEVASFNMGSMNFALYPYARRVKKWRYQWEKQYIEMTRDFVFRNTFADLEYFCKTMYENGTKPELECYDVSHLYNTYQLLGDGTLKSPLHIQFVMGILGGIWATVEDLVHMKQTADRLFEEGKYTWSACAAGRYEFPSCITSAMMGGHVRVGLEDNLYLRKGVLAKSNAELVGKVKMLIYEITGREAATPDEARKILGLKGGIK